MLLLIQTLTAIVCEIRQYKPKLQRNFISPWNIMFDNEPEAVTKACEWILEQQK